MKRYLLLLFLVTVNNISLFAEKQPQVAVFVYCDKTITTSTVALRSKLTSKLVNDISGSYIVVDRTTEILETLKKEQNYQSSGVVKDDQLVSIGEQLGATYLCVVSITYYSDYNQYFFECKLVNIETRQIEKHSFYPTNETIVSSLSPQQQIKVGEELSRAFNINRNYKLNGFLYDKNNQPLRINNRPVHIGYIDETGEHGFAFWIYPRKNSHYIRATGRFPYLSELQLLLVNKQIFNLNGEYWSEEFVTHSSNSYYSLDFASEKVLKRKGDMELDCLLIIEF